MHFKYSELFIYQKWKKSAKFEFLQTNTISFTRESFANAVSCDDKFNFE